MTYKLISHEGKNVYGKHLLLTANQCNEKILDLDKIVEFVKNLVEKIDMQAVGDPIAHHLDTETPFGGISVVQIIRTSTITIHTYDEPRDFYLDVFSCKDFNVKIVLSFVNLIFNPKYINHQVVYRN